MPKLIIAIKKYMEADGGAPVNIGEMKAFKDAMTDADRAEYRAWFESQGVQIED